MNHKYYMPPDKTWYSGRITEHQDYLYQLIKCSHINEIPQGSSTDHFGLLGYSCNEGVRRNQGRVGSEEGPQAIRKALGRLSIPFDRTFTLTDFGNIICPDSNLENASDTFAHAISKILEAGIMPIALGGGHDIVWGHYQGIRNYVGPEQSIGIINLDAHFDVRPDYPVMHSGSAFYQILHSDSNCGYLCLGIHEAVNPPSLFEIARDNEVQYVTISELRNMPRSLPVIQEFCQLYDMIYVTLDMDCMVAAYAPGVSAPATFGLCPDQVLSLLLQIIQIDNLISFDIAELNPRFDIDERTSRLAAQIIWFLLHQLSQERIY